MPIDPLQVTAAVILDARGRILTARRPPGDPRAGKWEFPGGKVEPGEAQVACLRRELREELGLEVGRVRRLFSVVHRYPDLTVQLHVHRCRALGVPEAREHDALTWLEPRRLAEPDWAAADREVVRRLMEDGGL